MSSELVVAVVQMTSVDDIEANLQQMNQLIEEIFKKANPRLLSFPENCLYLRVIEGEVVEGLTTDHSAFQFLAGLARQYSAYFHLGSVPLIHNGELFNSSVLISPAGQILPTYQKLHLFDIQLEGQKPIRESDVFRHGQKPSVIQVDGWKIGETICYDVRFAELFSQYAREEVDLILVPAAFLVKTGEAHWEILLRARAIESQAFVVASAQGGTHVGKYGKTRETYGHSLVVDPWGGILGQVQERASGYCVVTLSREHIGKVRQQIPMKSHRRLPVA